MTLRNRHVLLLDVAAILLAGYGAFVLRLDWTLQGYGKYVPPFLVIALAVKLITFFSLGLYSRYWRFAGLWDLLAVVLATVAAQVLVSGVIVGSTLFSDRMIWFPRLILPIDWMLTLLMVAGIRVSVRIIAESRGGPRESVASGRKRVLIAGAGRAGMLVLREMQQNRQLGLQAVGFIDDDPGKRGKLVSGLRVLGGLDELGAVAARLKVANVIIAMPTARGAIVRGIVDQCRRTGVESLVLPGVFELLDGKRSVSKLRHVQIADLLRRDQIISEIVPATYLTGHAVLVTGAGGSIGEELCVQVARSGPSSLILLGHGENSIFDTEQRLRRRFPDLRTETIIADIKDEARIRRVLARVRPKAIFHAAAHKHVGLMEQNPEEAVTNNVFGTLRLVRAAAETGVERFVMISTDKAVSPTSIMGASKRLAEAVVRSAAKRTGRPFCVVRFGNVLGSRGSVVPLFQQQIEAGGPVTVTHPDMKRFFMTIPEAVHLVLQAGGMAGGDDLFVLNMGEPVRIQDLVRDLTTPSGLDPGEIPILYTGIRPGEKLEEDLWEAGSKVLKTDNPDVLRVVEDEHLDTVILDHTLQALESATAQGRDDVRMILDAFLSVTCPTRSGATLLKDSH